MPGAEAAFSPLHAPADDLLPSPLVGEGPGERGEGLAKRPLSPTPLPPGERGLSAGATRAASSVQLPDPQPSARQIESNQRGPGFSVATNSQAGKRWPKGERRPRRASINKLHHANSARCRAIVRRGLGRRRDRINGHEGAVRPATHWRARRLPFKGLPALRLVACSRAAAASHHCLRAVL